MRSRHPRDDHGQCCRKKSLHPVERYFQPVVFAATLRALAIHAVASTCRSTQYLLRVEPIEAAARVRIVTVATSIPVAIEFHKLIRRRFAVGPHPGSAAEPRPATRPAIPRTGG